MTFKQREIAANTKFTASERCAQHWGQVHTHHYDALGSTTELTDVTGSVTDTFRYSAFGDQIKRTGTTQTPHTYVGQSGYQRDEPKRFYIRRRHYSAATDRWLSRDPIPLLLFPAPNQYSFVQNNPMQLIDPSGLQAANPCTNRSSKRFVWGDVDGDSCQECCCCVSGSRINLHYKIPSNGLDIPDYSNQFGHEFMWEVDVSYTPSNVTGDCTLEWWEYSTSIAGNLRPYGVQANKWQNIYAIIRAAGDAGKTSGTVGDIYKFETMPKPCPGNIRAQIKDCPYSASPRMLFFALKAKSAPGCNCPVPNVFATTYASQILVPGADPFKPLYWYFNPSQLRLPPGFPPASAPPGTPPAPPA